MYSWVSTFRKSVCAAVAVRQQSLAVSELLWKWANTNRTGGRASNMWSETPQSQHSTVNRKCVGHSCSLRSVVLLRVPYPHRHRWSRRAGLFRWPSYVFPPRPTRAGVRQSIRRPPSESANVLRGRRKPDGDLQEGNNNKAAHQSELLPSVSPR